MAYFYGYQRYQVIVMWSSVVVLVVLVQGIQMLGDSLAANVINKRR